MKAVVTYEDGTEAGFTGTPAVEAVEAVAAVEAKGVDMSAIPTDKPTVEN